MYVCQGDTIYILEVKRYISTCKPLETSLNKLGLKKTDSGASSGSGGYSPTDSPDVSVKLALDESMDALASVSRGAWASRANVDSIDANWRADWSPVTATSTNLTANASTIGGSATQQTEEEEEGDSTGNLIIISGLGAENDGVMVNATEQGDDFTPSQRANGTQSADGAHESSTSTAAPAAPIESSSDAPPVPPQDGNLSSNIHRVSGLSLPTSSAKLFKADRVPDRVYDPLYDPLLNPPPPPIEAPWHCGILLVIPLRLGVHTMNEEYYPVSFLYPILCTRFEIRI